MRAKHDRMTDKFRAAQSRGKARKAHRKLLKELAHHVSTGGDEAAALALPEGSQAAFAHLNDCYLDGVCTAIEDGVWDQ